MSAQTSIPSPPSVFDRLFKSGREDSPFKRFLIHSILILCCVIAIYPVLRVVTVSLRPGDRLLSTSLAIIPEDASFENFVSIVTEKDFLLWVWNSLMITGATAIVGVILASTSAYAFSRWRFPGRNAGMIFLLATQMIPAAMLMVPIFILAVKLELIGTYRGLIIAYSIGSVPFSVWILKGYYDTIPRDLEPPCAGDPCERLRHLDMASRAADASGSIPHGLGGVRSRVGNGDNSCRHSVPLLIEVLDIRAYTWRS
jgi:arabinogalactan oligomer/maltooligosaccharide transport system permease protein